MAPPANRKYLVLEGGKQKLRHSESDDVVFNSVRIGGAFGKDLFLDSGTINFSGAGLSNISAPYAPSDATTKKYVDDSIATAIDGLGNITSLNTDYTDTAIASARAFSSDQAALSNQYTDQSISGLSLQSSRYTPNVYPGSGVSGLSAGSCHVSRNKNSIMVSGRVEATSTISGNAECHLFLSLPVPSDFTSIDDLRGAGTRRGSPYIPVFIEADPEGNRARLEFSSNAAAAGAISFTFQYEVK